jgi:transposase
MDGSIGLKPKDRKVLLKLYRKSSDPALRLRAHVLLLLADGHAWSRIATMLFTSPRTISRWQRRFEQGGIDAVFGAKRGRPAVVLLLWEEHHINVSAETVRRSLAREQIVWRRPRPVLGLKDPDYARKLRAIRHLLATLPDDETAVFQDEVDVNTNPKIGSMWMRRGEQAEVETPGTNVKRHVAGSLHWRTGKLLVSEPGTRRNAKLFVAHLDDLRKRLRCYRHIYVICDNAKFHDCRLVDEFLARWGHRITLVFLPKYAPQANPIERVWWHLHEEITRNHRCQSIDELVELVFDWFGYKDKFAIETSIYPQALAA